MALLQAAGMDGRKEDAPPEVDASVRFTDNLFFLGEIDVRGQFTGKMKYLLRFR